MEHTHEWDQFDIEQNSDYLHIYEECSQIVDPEYFADEENDESYEEGEECQSTRCVTYHLKSIQTEHEIEGGLVEIIREQLGLGGVDSEDVYERIEKAVKGEVGRGHYPEEMDVLLEHKGTKCELHYNKEDVDVY